MSPSVATAERLRRTERVISFIRLAVVVFNVITYLLWAPDGDRSRLAGVVCVLALAYAVATVVHRPTAAQSRAVAVVNMVLDNVLIGIWLYATGGFSSPFYPLFYAEAAASIGRFGPRVGNISAAASALIYMVVVAVDSSPSSNYQLAVRIGYIFVIAAFVSYIVELARRSEREVAEAEREAATYLELDRLRSTFVTNISHELRTPLTAIRGAASTLVRHPDLPVGEQATLVNMVDRQSARLAALVQDVIDIGLLEQERLVPHATWCEVTELVAAQVEIARSLSGRHIDLTTDGEVVALCDGQKISNAVAKVIDNAIKFSPDGGKISVAVGRSGDMIRVSVRDEGIGIGPEHVERIFDRFHQVDGSHTRSAGGAGVGLSITKAILELHGGGVEVKTRKGKGSRFDMWFPREMPEPGRAPAARAFPSAGTAHIAPEPHPG